MDRVLHTALRLLGGELLYQKRLGITFWAAFYFCHMHGWHMYIFDKNHTFFRNMILLEGVFLCPPLVRDVEIPPIKHRIMKHHLLALYRGKFYYSYVNIQHFCDPRKSDAPLAHTHTSPSCKWHVIELHFQKALACLRRLNDAML